MLSENGTPTYWVSRTPNNWSEAQNFCVSIGMTLAQPKNLAENQLIASKVGAIHVWLGINDIAKEGDFKYADGSALSFEHWSPGL